ncbi:CNH-domain-containing protein [Xylona heveae TC161]|uniref:CNH-domain-containing protein n=1 Tax=Xylona heveae (strain CBS 132557 / TC161) TaxID=1328760 RepID=A0A165H4T2_XYLHT|nr:CNH-domain-containing protein [Xylona heveae TC161]KZF22985.1 CNH-domain-containing protein [Xylona heveae TC161]
MADYGTQQGRNYRPNNYGHASSYQRDAAFSSIFGATPPTGRSQTMTSQPAPISLPRSQTMVNLQTSEVGMQRGGIPARPPPNGTGQASTGSYYQGPRLPGAQVSSQPQPQYLPQPLHPDRRPYPQPQRVDPRQPVPQSYNKPVPNRGYPAGPAVNSDPFRSRSMAASMAPPPLQSPPSEYSMAPANAFRQPSFQSSTARTTAQGRIVPERHDERAMSMTSFSSDRDRHQTMSGRVIPSRRRESVPELDSTETSSERSVVPAPSLSAAAKARFPSYSSTQSTARSMSMASTTVASPSERNDSMQNRPPVAKTMSNSSQNAVVTTAQRRAPLVYPALLSKVADTFRERINVGERSKNDLTYKSAFTGQEAVDLIAYIIKTTDRNLALLLGRALDAQKFFHDVTYDHRLRDSPFELYQFRETLMEDSSDVNGVFTLLTECYSPTCTRDRLCYSIACPRRLEQQARLNLKPQPGLKREESRSSLHAEENDEQKLWINTVSKEVADSVSDKEKKRQEIIAEIMYTERDFVKDLEYLRDFWMKPLRSTNPASPSPIPEHRREKFIRTVFGNCLEVHVVNSKMAESLTRRQQQNPIVRNVGDIFLEFVPRFDPFIKYGANQLYGKYEFEKERASNPAFSRFVDETERLKESRKLELNGYLTKPTTRLARYPLLLENVQKYTAEDNPDTNDIPKAISLIRDFLSRVNVESGKAENHFNLMQLNQQLKFRQGEYVDLKLTEESRQLLYKGSLKKGPSDSADIHAYLFDHAVLFVRTKVVNKREELKVYRKPIPLELLVVLQMDELYPKMGIAKRPSSSLIPGSSKSMSNVPKTDLSSKQSYPITFRHLGKGGYDLTLYTNTHMHRKKWLEHIDAQQRRLRERSNIYTQTNLCERFFSAANRVNCLVPIDGGRKLVFGTDNGIYLSDRKPKEVGARPKRVLDVSNVTQIDVLEEYQLLLVLSNKTLFSYPLEALDPNEGLSSQTKKPKKIGHVNFFKAGVCLGRHLVCCVKTSALSTTIKVFEPMESMLKSKKKPALSKMFTPTTDALKPFKEFYIPTESSSIHFLKSKLCVGCARGFEVVSLETLETQSLLDQADTSLDFVARKENIKPIHIERLSSEFLLNYSDFSFFVNRNGWRARPDWKITWEGNPQAFALSAPYILAFEPSFIEIRHVETSALVHILTAKNIRMLHSSTREILYAYEDESGEDVVASLDFWSRSQ